MKRRLPYETTLFGAYAGGRLHRTTLSVDAKSGIHLTVWPQCAAPPPAMFCGNFRVSRIASMLTPRAMPMKWKASL